MHYNQVRFTWLIITQFCSSFFCNTFASYFLQKYSKSLLKPSDSSFQLLSIEANFLPFAPLQSFYITISKSIVSQYIRISVIKQEQLYTSFDIDASLQYVKCKATYLMKDDASEMENIILCLMRNTSTHLLLFYSIDGVLMDRWTISNAAMLHLETFSVASHFKYETLNVFMNSAIRTFSSMSAFIVLSDTKQVRLLRLPFAPMHLQMNWQDTNQQSTIFSSEQEITSLQVMVDSIRKPIHLTDNLNCSTVSFYPSQNVFLLLGVHNSSKDSNQLIVHHIFEFATQLFSSNDSISPLNPLNRDAQFDCENGYFFDGFCQSNEEFVYETSKRIQFIQQRFVNANLTVGSFPTYELNPSSSKLFQLNPITLCEVSRQMGNLTNYSQYLTCLLQVFESTKCEMDIFTKIDPKLLDMFFKYYWKNEIVIANSNSLEVISMLYQFDTLGTVKLEKSNQLPVIGTILDMEMSTNAQHIFVSLSRSKWQLDSQSRYNEICQLLQHDPDNPVFKSLGSLCNALAPRQVDFSQFAMAIHSCKYLNYCPTLTQSFELEALNGYFLVRPNFAIPCQKGYFCRAGVRMPCPPGFLCTESQLSLPQPCTSNSTEKTCFNEQLVYPAQLLNGTISVIPQFQPIASPPGYYKSESNELRACKLGDYCPFARQSTDDLTCPKYTFCTSPNVLLPQICSVNVSDMSYCPAGTFSEEHECPPGYYCSSLDVKVPCNSSQYCPSGSFVAALCPAGFYCPNSSIEIPCPRGYYCKAGSIQPSRCQWFNILNQCPGQTEQDRTYLSAFVINACLAFAFLLMYGCLLLYYKMTRKKEEKRRESDKEQMQIVPSVRDFPSLQQQSTAINENEFSKFKVNLRFENLGLKLRTNGKLVLQNICGEFPAGTVTCVMGPSGSGKSTFITTLANRAHYGIPLGKVLVNGQQTTLSKFNSRLGFVPQDDIMLRCMTVEETLYFAARTRLSAFPAPGKIKEIVDNVIDMLKLNKVRHEIIGDAEKRGISGGEMKRVNVGIELVSLPSLILCDEPTSGLDSYNSIKLMEALRNITKTGVSVVAVIHQPRFEIFQMFENLLLLEDGEAVYFGKCSEAVPYFESLGYDSSKINNPADFLLDITELKLVNQKSRAQCWREFTQQENITSPAPMEEKARFKKPIHLFILHFIWSLQRAIVQQLRDLKSFFTNMLLLLIAGFLMGIVFNKKVYKGPPPTTISSLCPGDLQQVCSLPVSDPIISSSAMMVLAIALCSGMAALPIFGKEKVVFQRESQYGLNSLGYFLAKDVANLPMILLAPIIFLSLYYFAITPRAPLWEYYCILLLLYWSSFGLSYIVSIVANPNIAQLACVVVIFVFNIFSGQRPMLPEYTQMGFPMSYVPSFSYLRYCLEVIYLNELLQYQHLYDINTSLQLFGYAVEDMRWIYFVIIGFGLLFRAIAFVCLHCSKPNSWFNFVVRYLSPSHLTHLFKECYNRVKQTKLIKNDEHAVLINETEEEAVSIDA